MLSLYFLQRSFPSCSFQAFIVEDEEQTRSLPPNPFNELSEKVLQEYKSLVERKQLGQDGNHPCPSVWSQVCFYFSDMMAASWSSWTSKLTGTNKTKKFQIFPCTVDTEYKKNCVATSYGGTKLSVLLVKSAHEIWGTEQQRHQSCQTPQVSALWWRDNTRITCLCVTGASQYLSWKWVSWLHLGKSYSQGLRLSRRLQGEPMWRVECQQALERGALKMNADVHEGERMTALMDDWPLRLQSFYRGGWCHWCWWDDHVWWLHHLPLPLPPNDTSQTR